MLCKTCKSPNRRELPAEIAIHFLGRENLDRPAVYSFPTLLVCLECGFTEMVLSETELLRLRERRSAPA
jgi:hypothetical protein